MAGTPAQLVIKLCKDLTKRRKQYAAAAAGAQAMEQTFTAYATDLMRMDQFKYLDKILAIDDNDLPAMRRNLKKARGIWGRLACVLIKESVPGPVAGLFYPAVVVFQRLYGSETWVLSPSVLQCLEGFHVEAVRRLTSTRPQRVKRKWDFSPLRMC